MSGSASAGSHEETFEEHEAETDDVIARGTAAVSTVAGAAALGAAAGGPEIALIGAVVIAMLEVLLPSIRRLLQRQAEDRG